MLLEGVPLKAASCQGGKEWLVDWGVSSTTGDPGWVKTKGDGDWRVLAGVGTSKTSESKFSAMKTVGGPGGEGTEHGGPRREKSSDSSDKREGLAGYWSSGDASGSRK